MVGGPDVQTNNRKDEKCLFHWKHQPGLAFGPLFTCKNWGNFNPSRRVNPSLDKGYPANGADQAWLLFFVHAYKHLTAKGLPAAGIQPALKSNPGSCKKAPRVFLGDLNKQPPSQGDIMRD